ncbi:hypothetical protein D1610_11100 [Sphingomonas gilva]|uniref:Uncharacterized protein n=1 Tax=Sphingomonas gilva TaxID=2305907 RepID=A0A396RQF7_9SPHN|nr:hypothetical protein D1610_11100 [Sphingomonas gilva]
MVVIDNFSPCPEQLVEDATTLTFSTWSQYYPGVRAQVTPRYFDGLAAILAPVVRDVFGFRNRLEVSGALYSLATTPPGDLALPQRIPHFDGVEDGMIAIIHYLTRAGASGTSFYRHRSTGFETVNAARHRIYLDALQADFRTHGEPPPGYIAGDTPIFERIADFAPAWNRALIYRSSLLHCAAIADDSALTDDPRTGRLTVASFLSAE